MLILKLKTYRTLIKKKFILDILLVSTNIIISLTIKTIPTKRTLINQKPGLSVGLIGDLKLKKNLNLRFEPGLYTNKSDIIFYDRSQNLKISDTLRTIKSTYIHLPYIIKI